jgi:GTPase
MAAASGERGAGSSPPGAPPHLGRLVDELAAGLAGRQPRLLGRAISLVEAGGEGAAALIGRIHPRTGGARVVGVTGAAGSGKSTLVDRLVQRYRQGGEGVGVLAVDPTSPLSGGALLGDRIRMGSLATDPGVYIRSLATRGAPGGLARATHDAVSLLDAAGFERILVETVGVGQDEVDVVRSVDTVVLVTVPGLGDDVQAAKAGLLEVADVLVLNKADREGAERARRDLEEMLSLGAGGGWRPPIVATVATTGEGIAELAAAVERHRDWLEASGQLAVRRRDRLRLRVERILTERLLAAAEGSAAIEREVSRAAAEGVDPYRAAARLGAELGGIWSAGGAAEAVAGIDHVGVAVTSIAEARRFYEALGLAVAAVEEVPDEGVRVALIPCGASRIELLEPLSPDSAVGRFLARRGPGIHHLCLAAADVRGASARLRRAGYELLRPEPTRGAGGCWVQFVHPRSAGGVLYELSERGSK